MKSISKANITPFSSGMFFLDSRFCTCICAGWFQSNYLFLKCQLIKQASESLTESGGHSSKMANISLTSSYWLLTGGFSSLSWVPLHRLLENLQGLGAGLSVQLPKEESYGREQCRSNIIFYDLAQKVTHHKYCNIFLVEQVSHINCERDSIVV